MTVEKIDSSHPALMKIKSFCCDKKIIFKINKNIHNLLSVAKERNGVGKKVSLHWIFLEAPDFVLQRLADFIKAPDADNRMIIRRYIAENSHKIDSTSLKRRLREITKGYHYDLRILFDKINNTYFNGNLNHLKITWGRKKIDTRKKFNSINFGSFSHSEQCIRIHPVLDNSFVPQYFLEYIIYHEMLHSIIHPKITHHYFTCYHHSDFKQREQDFKYYENAIKWQKENLAYILKNLKSN